MPINGTDAQTADLIDQAQAYSHPIDRIPTPEAGGPGGPLSPDSSRDFGEPVPSEGRVQPSWFKPVDRPDDTSFPQNETSFEVPVIVNQGDVPD
ncbi:MAG: hypothetical protein ACREDI_05435, partial [Roseiarcus sp.]